MRKSWKSRGGAQTGGGRGRGNAPGRTTKATTGDATEVPNVTIQSSSTPSDRGLASIPFPKRAINDQSLLALATAAEEATFIASSQPFDDKDTLPNAETETRGIGVNLNPDEDDGFDYTPLQDMPEVGAAPTSNKVTLTSSATGLTGDERIQLGEARNEQKRRSNSKDDVNKAARSSSSAATESQLKEGASGSDTDPFAISSSNRNAPLSDSVTNDWAIGVEAQPSTTPPELEAQAAAGVLSKEKRSGNKKREPPKSRGKQPLLFLPLFTDDASTNPKPAVKRSPSVRKPRSKKQAVLFLPLFSQEPSESTTLEHSSSLLDVSGLTENVESKDHLGGASSSPAPSGADVHGKEAETADPRVTGGSMTPLTEMWALPAAASSEEPPQAHPTAVRSSTMTTIPFAAAAVNSASQTKDAEESMPAKDKPKRPPGRPRKYAKVAEDETPKRQVLNRAEAPEEQNHPEETTEAVPRRAFLNLAVTGMSDKAYTVLGAPAQSHISPVHVHPAFQGAYLRRLYGHAHQQNQSSIVYPHLHVGTAAASASTSTSSGVWRYGERQQEEQLIDENEAPVEADAKKMSTKVGESNAAAKDVGEVRVDEGNGAAHGNGDYPTTAIGDDDDDADYRPLSKKKRRVVDISDDNDHSKPVNEIVNDDESTNIKAKKPRKSKTSDRTNETKSSSLKSIARTKKLNDNRVRSGKEWTEEEDIMFLYLLEVRRLSGTEIARTLDRTKVDIEDHLNETRPLEARERLRKDLKRKITSVRPFQSAFEKFAFGKVFVEAKRTWRKMTRRDREVYENESPIDKKRFFQELRKIGVTQDQYSLYRRLQFPAKFYYNGELWSKEGTTHKRTRPPEDAEEEYLAAEVLPREQKLRAYQQTISRIPVWMNLLPRDPTPWCRKAKTKPKEVANDSSCDF